MSRQRCARQHEGRETGRADHQCQPGENLLLAGALDQQVPARVQGGSGEHQRECDRRHGSSLMFVMRQARFSAAWQFMRMDLMAWGAAPTLNPIPTNRLYSSNCIILGLTNTLVRGYVGVAARTRRRRTN